MALVEKFSGDHYYINKINDYTLLVILSGSPSIYNHYDFLQRVLLVSTGYHDGGAQATPFSQLDREFLEFVHAKFIELGGKPPALPNAFPKETSEAWIRMGNKAIAHVGVYLEAQRKLTDIFNFESRQHIVVNENLKTHAELTTQPVSFDSLPQATLEKALEQFTKAGGTVDKDFVLRGIVKIDKKSSFKD
jgi:hypothetical protein